MSTSNPEENGVLVFWFQLHGKRCLRFDFHGSFSEEEAIFAIERWKNEVSNMKPGEEVDLIWNCLDMKKYTAGAAKIWKNAMSNFSNTTGFIWLVSTNPFIKMGAKTVTFLLPLKLKPVSSIEEIPAG